MDPPPSCLLRDYFLTCYREFFEEMFKSSDLDYPLPVQVAKYSIKEYELKGEIISWCYEFLMARKCHPHLAAILCNEALKEALQAMKDNREAYGYRPNVRSYSSLPLMQMTIKHLVSVCSNYRDNAKLSTLPPPPDTFQGSFPSASTHSVKNTRRKMEDRHVAIRDLNALYNIKGCGSASYYAVFDGHNGADAAAYCCCHVHQFLVESPFYNNCPQLAFADAFQLTDSRFIEKSANESLDSGTTVLCALIKDDPKCLYVAWLGDSQAVLVSRGKYSQLVLPHRPDNKDERDRISNLGGTVIQLDTWRVNGQLAVSRAIGDAKHKPSVSSDPDVRIVPLTGSEEFLVMASDGLWDFVTEEEVVEGVYGYLHENQGETDGVAKHLVESARTRFSRDNISVVVVFLSEPDPRTIAGIAGGDMSVQREVDVAGELWMRQSTMPTLDCLSPVNNDFSGTDSDKLCMAKALVSQALSMDKWVQPASLGKEQRELLSKLPWNCRPNPLSYADALKQSPPKSAQEIGESEESSSEDVSTSEENVVESAVGKAEIEEETGKIAACEKKEEETNNDVADAEADSGEESEEEWNYVSGKRNQQPSETNQQIPSDDDMSQLNPNAAEFVPVLPSLEPVLASSPAKGSEKSLEDIRLPSKKKFFKEISSRPADLDSSFENCSANNSTSNGDDLTGLSTKAEFGDDSFSPDVSSWLNDKENSVEATERFDSTNPFADDAARGEPVENHFETNTSQPATLNDKTDEVKVDDLLSMNADFGRHSEKPDLLSPHQASNNEQQTSSSGFDSESGNEEPDFAANDKCDLIADMPVTDDKHPAETTSNPFFTENEAGDGARLFEDEEIITSLPSKAVDFDSTAEQKGSSLDADVLAPVSQVPATMDDLMRDFDFSEKVEKQEEIVPESQIPPEFQFSVNDHAKLSSEIHEMHHESEFAENIVSSESERLSVFKFSDSVVEVGETTPVPTEPYVEQSAESDSFELINAGEEDFDSMKGIQNLQEDHREMEPVESAQELPSLIETSVNEQVHDLIMASPVEYENMVESVEKPVEETKFEEIIDVAVEKEEVVEASAPPRSPSPVDRVVVEKVEEESVPQNDTEAVETTPLNVVYDSPVAESLDALPVVNESLPIVVDDSPAPLVEPVLKLDTPPTTPAAEPTEDSGLTAAAIGTAGIAAVAGAAAVLSSTTKKEEAKPSIKGSPIKKSPVSATSKTKKPEPISKTTANKTNVAPKSGPTKPSSASTVAAAPKRAPTTTAATSTTKPLTARTTTAAAKTAPSKPTTPTTASKPTTPTAASKPATPTSRTTAASKSPASPIKSSTTSKPVGAVKTSAAPSAPKPRVGASSAAKLSTTTSAPKPTTATSAKSAVSSTVKKVDSTKTTAPARSTVSSRPTSATSTTSRPSSATARAAPVKSSTTTTTRPPTTTTATRPVPKSTAAATSVKPATTALKMAAKVPAVKASAPKTTSVAPSKPKSAAPTVVKKPGAADKLPKDTVNNKLSSKLVANSKKPSLEVGKTGKGSPEKAAPESVIVNNGEEPVTQEPIVTTTSTNGHVDNGVDSMETFAYSTGVIESL